MWLQVLGQLPSDLVIEVLRSAPGSLQEHLPYLSPHLASHAALAHVPSLAAVCSPAPECADQGASLEHTALTLCVYTTSEQETQMAVANTIVDPVDCVAGAGLWLHRDEDKVDNLERGLFTLQSRPGMAVCRLQARTSSLQGMTVYLPDFTCLEIGPGTPKLQGVTFQGANCFTGCFLLLSLMCAPFHFGCSQAYGSFLQGFDSL